ncbi:MAG: hypothetical protein ABJF01_07520 [bacterium]
MTEQPTDDPLAAVVRAAAPTSFDDGFGDRVLSRLGTRSDQAFTSALNRQFRLVVPLAAAAAVILAAFNWWGARGTAASPFDAALNLPQVTLSSAYSVTSLYGVAVPTETP